MSKNRAIELQSLVDSHREPFVIIDHDFRILAVNRAFEQAYGSGRDWAVGRPCYRVSHHNPKPCAEIGEECPHVQVFQTGESHTCLHLHHDQHGRRHRVRVTGFPLRGADGTLYMGEMIEDISAPEERRVSGVRMVGNAPVFLACMEQLNQAAAADVPVLLMGQTGTGKELAANYIHDNSARAGRPFLTLDCAVLTESLFEAEVFGHERGAFTGSVGEKPGLFELADSGTVFLDEIGDMPLPLQTKLLRVLETGEFRRVGARRTLQVDVRVICATNRDLWAEVEAKRFREDLYHRVACISVTLPSLDQRRSDIPALARALLERIARKAGKRLFLTPRALEHLKRHNYRGNIRELRNILGAAAACSCNGRIGAREIADVLERFNGARQSEPESREAERPAVAAETAGERREQVEARHLEALLRRYDGNRRKVAAALGVTERTVYRMLKRHGLR